MYNDNQPRLLLPVEIFRIIRIRYCRQLSTIKRHLSGAPLKNREPMKTRAKLYSIWMFTFTKVVWNRVGEREQVLNKRDFLVNKLAILFKMYQEQKRKHWCKR